jgi:hypothetical protein
LIAVALLAVVVSLYALAAIGYRTWEGGITLNRLTIIGWNVINIGILALLLLRQRRADAQTLGAGNAGRLRRGDADLCGVGIVCRAGAAVAVPLSLRPCPIPRPPASRRAAVRRGAAAA